MTVFADSSALVKIYADEPGSEEVRALEFTVISSLARIEVTAAIWRKHRMGQLSLHLAQTLLAAFEFDYTGSGESPVSFLPVAVSDPILESATKLAALHQLRAYDAVQLATAAAAAEVIAECDSFAAFDKTLRAAAAIEGFLLVPAELPQS